MIVVTDSSPPIVLVKIGHVGILPSLFGEVFMPPQVAAELAESRRPPAVRDFIQHKPDWLRIQRPASVELIPRLDEGERAAISLATELSAGMLLIDENRGRSAARERHLQFTGSVGVLVRAAQKGLLDLADAFARIKQTDFWISHAFLEIVLARFRDQQI